MMAEPTQEGTIDVQMFTPKYPPLENIQLHLLKYEWDQKNWELEIDNRFKVHQAYIRVFWLSI